MLMKLINRVHFKLLKNKCMNMMKLSSKGHYLNVPKMGMYKSLISSCHFCLKRDFNIDVRILTKTFIDLYKSDPE